MIFDEARDLAAPWPLDARTRVSRWVVRTAIAGNVFLAVCAFWMSFTALADLARRAGVAAQPWVWPLIVDGLIVVSTVSVMALSPFGRRATWFAWLLLFGGAAVSVLGNGAHAIWYGEAGVPASMRVTIAAVPPLVLLAVTHLTTELARRSHPRPPSEPAGDGAPTRARTGLAPAVVDAAATNPDRIEAGRLRSLGWTNRRIARALDVHPSTVSRWLTSHDEPAEAGTPGEQERARQESSTTT